MPQIDLALVKRLTESLHDDPLAYAALADHYEECGHSGRKYRKQSVLYPLLRKAVMSVTATDDEREIKRMGEHLLVMYRSRHLRTIIDMHQYILQKQRGEPQTCWVVAVSGRQFSEEGLEYMLRDVIHFTTLREIIYGS